MGSYALLRRVISAPIAYPSPEPRKELRGGRLSLDIVASGHSPRPARLQDGERVLEKGRGRSTASAGRIGLERDGQVSRLVDCQMSPSPPPR